MTQQRDWALCFWMLGVSVAHGLRFFLFDDPANRVLVAVGGVIVYALAAVFAVNHLTVLQKVAGLIAVVFPLVGLGAVLATGAQVDDWQLAVGVTQFAAIPYIATRWFSWNS